MRWCGGAAELRRGVSGYARTIQTLQRHQIDHHIHLQQSPEAMCKAQEINPKVEEGRNLNLPGFQPRLGMYKRFRVPSARFLCIGVCFLTYMSIARAMRECTCTYPPDAAAARHTRQSARLCECHFRRSYRRHFHCRLITDLLVGPVADHDRHLARYC